MQASDALGSLLSKLSTDIQGAAAKGDFKAVERLTKFAMNIGSSKSIVDEVHTAYGCCPGISGKKQFTVEITAGAIKNSYLSVTEGIAKGYLHPGDVLKLLLPNGAVITTKVMVQNRLQERGEIGKFYAKQQVQPGNSVIMSEISSGTWSLKKA
jgi:hypothetical protein